jgi:hypothetical protein
MDPVSLKRHPLFMWLMIYLFWILVTCFYSAEPLLSVKYFGQNMVHHSLCCFAAGSVYIAKFDTKNGAVFVGPNVIGSDTNFGKTFVSILF